jgi:peroxiredoxin
MTTRRNLLLGLGAVGGLAAIGTWATRRTPAPLVSGQTLSGEAVSTQALLGRPYLVNFWATSCVTCVREMPELVSLHQAFEAKGFRTLAVAMHYDRPEFLQRFVEDRQLPFWVLHDTDNQWAKAWGDVSVTPTTFVVDAKGRVYKRFVGEPDFGSLRRWLSKNLTA